MKPRILQGIKHTNTQLIQEGWPAPLGLSLLLGSGHFLPQWPAWPQTSHRHSLVFLETLPRLPVAPQKCRALAPAGQISDQWEMEAIG